ncbi:helix-turn-helix domain-containing protein [Streptomyces sp. NPDC058000]|uniref:helix-turn-helix domain-containing protein n=1 Tax=Streptomyces sp. NPDC058000 TaxID=3346299 RepID=UPI0036E87D9A
MPSVVYHGVGPRIAYERRIAGLTQSELARVAGIALGTLRKIERGERGCSDAVLEALATALSIDPARLLPDQERRDDHVHQAMPALSAVLAEYESPEDGPHRDLGTLQEVVSSLVGYRLSAQYVRISRTAPALIAELCRALQTASAASRPATARLLVDACRAADAVAFKSGARDLSARIIDLMRWAANHADDPLMNSTVAYVRTETYFAAKAHAAGLRALEQAVGRVPQRNAPSALAARGSLHMRAAVIAGRAGDGGAAGTHLGSV